MEKKNEYGNEDAHLQIKFSTKQEKYAVPNSTIDCPGRVDKRVLNEILNDLLKSVSEEWVDVEFDFLVKDELLRTDLTSHITTLGVNTEQEIVVEYFKAVPTPKPLDCLTHDDWVSSVHSAGKWILTGCYDTSIHIWSAKGKHHLAIQGHAAAVSDVCWIKCEKDVCVFASTSHDETLKIWEWHLGTNSVKNLFVCKGHERTVNCLDVFEGKNIATGSYDGNLKIWSADTAHNLECDNEASLRKQQKLDGSGAKIRVPLSTLKAHKESVSSVQWLGENEIVTSSMDHTIKIWDVEYGGMKSEIVANKAIFAAHRSVLNGNILTCGDRHIRMYDPRSSEQSVMKSMFTSHKEWVSAVKWSSVSPNLFSSAGYDKLVKIWDMRSFNTPVYDLLGHDDKVLSLDWSIAGIVASGGADCTLRMFKVNQDAS